MTSRLLALALVLATAGCVEDFPSVAPFAGDADVSRPDLSVDARALDPDAERPPDATPNDAGPAFDAAILDGAVPPEPDMRAIDMDVADVPCVPTDEVCNGLDEDCDGVIDEDLPGAEDPCELGVGACVRPGVLRCDAAAEALVCSAMPGMEIVETCNGIDDDCDGMADEALGLGDACTVGQGVCAAAGAQVCDDAGGVICDAQPGPASDEICNALDDDCDGAADEGLGLGTLCAEGVGACERAGVIACFEDAARCDAVPGPAQDERCNAVDDDCDGTTDEGLGLGDDCEIGVGACTARGVQACGDADAVVCDAEIIEPVPEVCNGVDDDCDGTPDEDLTLGERCAVGVGECVNEGENVCGDADDVVCSVAPLSPQVEVCDGLDNDCDDRIDEGAACAGVAVSSCQVWLGWRDNHRHNADRTLDPSDTWGNCPGSAEDQRGESRCTSTRRNTAYQSLQMKGGADNNDLMAIRFTCDADPIPTWIQQHCEIFLAYGDLTPPAVIEGLDPDSCGSTFSLAPFGTGAGCARTENDGRFHPVAFVGGVNADDGWGVALRCADPAQPDRAAGLQASLRVQLGFQDRGQRFIGGCFRGRISNSESWRSDDDEDCPLVGSDLNGRETCASSSGDGQFHGLRINAGDMGDCWSMGIALKRVP